MPTPFISTIGLMAAFLTTAAFMPQAYKTLKTRSTKDLSLVTYGMSFVGTLLWLIYGWYIKDLPLVIANVISSMVMGTIFYLKWTEKP
jgi:MtN3 and saliva related transmembrane protein